MIRLEHIRKEYPGVVPLADVSAEIRDGDVISVIGPSGTGKSTLLRCINMLETPTSGSIWLDDTEITAPGCDLSKVRQKMGMVFQSFHLFSHLSVIENLMLAPIDLLGQSRQEAYDKGLELLKTVGLERAIPISCPAARNSVSPLPEPWRWDRKLSCLTSRPVPSTPPWSAKCRLSSASSRAREKP